MSATKPLSPEGRDGLLVEAEGRTASGSSGFGDDSKAWTERRTVRI